MATTKLYDLAVKTGEYQDRNGNTKGRYENIGSVMRNDNGQFMMLKKTFNPAGVDSKGDSILVSMFEPKPRDGGGYQNSQSQRGPGADLDDDLPF